MNDDREGERSVSSKIHRKGKTESLDIGLVAVQCTRCDVRVEIGRPRVADRYSTLAFSHISDVRAMTRARVRVSEIVGDRHNFGEFNSRCRGLTQGRWSTVI